MLYPKVVIDEGQRLVWSGLVAFSALAGAGLTDFITTVICDV